MFIPDYEFTPAERAVCEIVHRLSDVRRMLGVAPTGGTHPHWWSMIAQANGAKCHLLALAEETGDAPRDTVADAMRRFGEPFDAVLWWHGPERLEKAQALGVIETLWEFTGGTLIVGYATAAESDRTGAVRRWPSQDFRLSGFRTERVDEGNGRAHVTAWRYRVESLRYDLHERTVERLYYAGGDDPPIRFPAPISTTSVWYPPTGDDEQDGGERGRGGEEVRR